MTFIQQCTRHVIVDEVVAKATQTYNVLTYGARTHVGLFEEVLFEADDIEERTLLLAVQIAAEAAQRGPGATLLLPSAVVH